MKNEMSKFTKSYVARGIEILFGRQTSDEQACEVTIHWNRRGFNASEARCGTYLARKIAAGERLDSHDWSKAREIAFRHRRQIAEELAR